MLFLFEFLLCAADAVNAKFAEMERNDYAGDFFADTENLYKDFPDQSELITQKALDFFEPGKDISDFSGPAGWSHGISEGVILRSEFDDFMTKQGQQVRLFEYYTYLLSEHYNQILKTPASLNLYDLFKRIYHLYSMAEGDVQQKRVHDELQQFTTNYTNKTQNLDWLDFLQKNKVHIKYERPIALCQN